jgi:hypothetical protein
MNTHTTLAAFQNTVVPDGSGNVKAVGVALVFLVLGWYMAKHSFLLYGKFLEEKMANVKFDWKSLMSFLLGFAGVTVLIGAPRKGLGFFSTLIDAPQKFFMWIGTTGVGAAVGMWFICAAILVVTLKKAMKDKGDSIQDMKMGALCAFAFPLGGMPFAWLSMTIANAVIELMNGIPVGSAAS